jgi:hypothetical protein
MEIGVVHIMTTTPSIGRALPAPVQANVLTAMKMTSYSNASTLF